MAITNDFKWVKPEVIPSFLQGKDAREIYRHTKGIRTEEMGYDSKDKLIYGSTPFLAARVDTLVRPLGLRVTTLRDLIRPEVMEMIEGEYYSDTPALIARSETDPDYLKNNPILEMLMNEAAKRHEKLPFMVTGFDVAPNPKDKEGYGIKLIPRDDFKLVTDKRFGWGYHGKRFSRVDKQGLPSFDENGTRTWYARRVGLSRLFLDDDLNLKSSYPYLDYSLAEGQVVLISDAVASQISLR
jgi:hypothetical protein